MSLYMLQLTLAPRPLLAWAHQVRVPTQDTGYLIHAGLRALFAEAAPQPFAVLGDAAGGMSGSVFTVLGYGPHPKDMLAANAQILAEPLLHSALVGPILDKPMPLDWPTGRLFNFRTRVCPVRRRSTTPRRMVERDAFLAACEQYPDRQHDRGETYSAWLGEQLERDQAATLLDCRMTAFCLTPLRRKTRSSRSQRLGDRPDVRMEGTLRVNDPKAFGTLMARGVGRHRAFGFGMLLLRPA
ncbi:type I-E CRISPR-associated protein Cas6/Cse3/CasE [Fundidesulfovibrio putealis]|uniref:type I-E CRISPR-associated protein Cas6/Cse3/CasE n=1 Tax=Fundidesulfovibrio putealis TaxID=270496 RepID=UPI00041A9647|nr:type I-E CRISPR-associated protein Cas6/Cse3/CasE [Fundidesulfovibrio putealis]